jgi:hypothetical protein
MKVFQHAGKHEGGEIDKPPVSGGAQASQPPPSQAAESEPVVTKLRG